ncbi:hypothetical protein [Devosia sp.]|uniref:hypothetical protein n=1 Tax=Devosia sp. TaxID=1871048 RepID=UPI003A8C911A
MQRGIVESDTFQDRLLKLLPAELTAVFLAIRSVVELGSGNTPQIGAWLSFFIIVVLTLATPVVLGVFRTGVDWSLRLFMAATFLIWSLNIDIGNVLLISHGELVPLVQMVLPILVILWAGIAWPSFAHFSGKH